MSQDKQIRRAKGIAQLKDPLCSFPSIAGEKKKLETFVSILFWLHYQFAMIFFLWNALLVCIGPTFPNPYYSKNTLREVCLVNFTIIHSIFPFFLVYHSRILLFMGHFYLLKSKTHFSITTAWYNSVACIYAKVYCVQRWC